MPRSGFLIRNRDSKFTTVFDEVFVGSDMRVILAEYARHYNEHRAHQSQEQRPPLHEPGQPVDVTGRIKRRQVVHALISEYRRAA